MNHSKSARARECTSAGPDHPDQVAAAPLLLAQPRGQLLVVDRPLPAHLGGHEAELVGPWPPPRKPWACTTMPSVPSSASPMATSSPRRAAGLDGLQPLAALHDHAVHPGPGRAPATGRPPGCRSAGWRSRRSLRAARRRPAAARTAPSGAPANGGWLKSGNVSWEDRCIWGRKVGERLGDSSKPIE